jgi:hypothetical protein
MNPTELLNDRQNRWPAILLSTSLLANGVMIVVLAAHYLIVSWRIASARDQVTQFIDSVQRAVKSPSKYIIDDEIRFLKEYYPSGSKQVNGSNLDMLVESVRVDSIRQIEAIQTEF